LIDGIALAIIASCTVLEGVEEWKDSFSKELSDNQFAIIFWFFGLSSAFFGLILLIINAAIIEMLPFLETFGMTLLTIGPLINMIACHFYVDLKNPSFSFNRRWLVSELLELSGMILLDLSYIDCGHHIMLATEVLGFIVLSMAALIELNFSSDGVPIHFSLRLDYIRVSDSFGLFLLILVAIGKYRIHINRSSLMKIGGEITTTPTTLRENNIQISDKKKFYFQNII